MMKLESVLATCDCQVGQTDRQVDPHGRSLLVAPLAQRLLTHELFEIKTTRNKREEEEEEEADSTQESTFQCGRELADRRIGGRVEREHVVHFDVDVVELVDGELKLMMMIIRLARYRSLA